MLPRSYVLPSSPNTVGWPIASRSPFNTYEGHLGDMKVRVKQLQNYSTVDPEQAKHVCPRYRHLSPFPLMIRVGLLSGGRCLETFGASKHRPPPGRYRRPLPIHCGLDAGRRAPGTYQYAPVRRPAQSRRCLPSYVG